MENYSYQKQLKAIWQQAVTKYESGNRAPDSYFDEATLSELASIGLNTMDVYDYAEDFVTRGEPDFETFLMVCEARRDYFLNVMKGEASDKRLDPATLPAKTDEINGIVWLPRIMPKAIAKLRGEMPPEIMYGCGGDRNFFKENKLHPAEFLRAAWAYENDLDGLVSWVETKRSES